jgi:hypothetical protein
LEKTTVARASVVVDGMMQARLTAFHELDLKRNGNFFVP